MLYAYTSRHEALIEVKLVTFPFQILVSFDDMMQVWFHLLKDDINVFKLILEQWKQDVFDFNYILVP